MGDAAECNEPVEGWQAFYEALCVWAENETHARAEQKDYDADVQECHKERWGKLYEWQ